MSTEKREKGKTYVTTTDPWGLHPRNGHRLLCADGVIRAARLAQTADTFFSVPVTIRIKGKTVSGYMTCEEQGWIRGVKETEPFLTAWVFRKHVNGTHADLIPTWPDKFGREQKFNNLIAKAYRQLDRK